jgi:phenylalanyl-tRNA synthetase beta chain
MKVPLKWLAEASGHHLKDKELSDLLTFAGLEVEGLTDGLDGKVLELALTPNRGDCLSINGLVREINALLNIKSFVSHQNSSRQTVNKGVAKVSIEQTSACWRYCGWRIADVKVAASPAWMQKRLQDCGVRPINTIVDATNYVMLETGQPLHAFDSDLLRGDGICVRFARRGETLITLDGEERKLLCDDLVIADTSGAIALAGVMGGTSTAIHEKTKSLFLESAYFDASLVRRTSRRLGLQTESSYRFERGVDWFGVNAAMKKLADLIVEISGGQIQGAMTDVIKHRPKSVVIPLTPERVNALLGSSWKRSEISALLKRIGCRVKKGIKNQWSVTVPCYRHDLHEDVDLIEELARLKGYESINSQLPSPQMHRVSLTPTRQWRRRVCSHLASLGFSETIHFSFSNQADLQRLGSHCFNEAPQLANPLSQEMGYLRPNLFMALLNLAQRQHFRQISDLRLFELRNVFKKKARGVQESLRLCALLSGRSQPIHWSRSGALIDFYEAKGVFESVLELMSDQVFYWEPLPHDHEYATLLNPGVAALCRVGKHVIGVCGDLHPHLFQELDLKAATCLFEIDWSLLLGLRRADTRYQKISQYPASERDLAILVDEKVGYAQIEALIKEECQESLQTIEIFDIYRGKPVPAGKKSVAFRVMLREKDRTLTDEEVQEIHHKLVNSLKKDLQAEIR